MTNEYAQYMWLKYLKQIRLTDSRRILKNPLDEFKTNLKNGDYDILDDDEYDELLEGTEQESALYNNELLASAYTIFLRGFQALRLTKGELSSIAALLSESTSRSGFNTQTKYKQS